MFQKMESQKPFHKKMAIYYTPFTAQEMRQAFLRVKNDPVKADDVARLELDINGQDYLIPYRSIDRGHPGSKDCLAMSLSSECRYRSAEGALAAFAVRHGSQGPVATALADLLRLMGVPFIYHSQDSSGLDLCVGGVRYTPRNLIHDMKQRVDLRSVLWHFRNPTGEAPLFLDVFNPTITGMSLEELEIFILTGMRDFEHKTVQDQIKVICALLRGRYLCKHSKDKGEAAHFLEVGQRALAGLLGSVAYIDHTTFQERLKADNSPDSDPPMHPLGDGEGVKLLFELLEKYQRLQSFLQYGH